MMKTGIVVVAFSAAAALIAASNSDGKRWWSYVETLAADEMKGRGTGTPEHLKAAQFVASEFQKAGLQPAGSDGFRQAVKFRVWKIVEAECSLELLRDGKRSRLALGEDAYFSRSEPAGSVEAPLVFVGYGLTVPEMNYDDFAGLNVRGKIAVMISGGPSNIPAPLKSHYQTTRERGHFLKKAGVLGTVTIQNPRTSDIPWSRSALSRFQERMELVDPALADSGGLKISLVANPASAEKWFEGSGHTIEELLALVGAGKELPRFTLVPSLRATAKVEKRDVESRNVVAMRPGSDPTLKNEYVVLSAHLDHLGVGEPINGDSIYNGALDNAAGVATLIDVAWRLGEEKIETKRSLLFVAVTGEEKGLLGSRFFAAHPTVARKSMVANLNMDMFLPLYPLRRVTVYGLAESDLGDTVRRVAHSLKLEVQPDPAPHRNAFIRSDQYSFIRSGIPSLKVDFGFEKGSPEAQKHAEWLKSRYHAPSDDLSQPVDVQAAGQYNQLIMMLAETVANSSVRPHWKADSFFRRFAP
jgi:hypothetical protein